MTLKRRLSSLSMWSASIPTAILFVVAGLFLEPSKESIFLYVASVLCAGASVVRFIVRDLTTQDMCEDDRLAPDEQPELETTRPVKV
jgi:hypothetical protein